MKQRIILVGGGETVYYLARQMKRQGHRVTIINRDAAACHALFHDTEAIVVHGDGSSQTALEEAGARQADIVLALTPYDQDNLVTCQIAQRIFGVPRTIALVNDPENEEIFMRLGVTNAFSATHIIATMIEKQTKFEHIKRLMHVGSEQVQVTDVELGDESPSVGKTLSELALGEDVLVASIVRGKEVIIPRGSHILQAGDHLLVISRSGQGDKDLELLLGEGN